MNEKKDEAGLVKTIKINFDGFSYNKTYDYEERRESKLILKVLRKHYNVEISDSPDYVFYNVDGKNYYKYDGIRIFVTIEAIFPDFNLCDYAIGFEYLDFRDRYFRFPNYLFYPDAVARMQEKHRCVAQDAAKRKFCSFVYSNDRAEAVRKELFEKLSEYKQVDSGGRYLNNLPDGQPVEDKYEFEKQYKFSIACENASYPGYHTEKLVEAFAAGTVPIYWGDPEVGKVFNEKAFINCNSYSCIEEALEKIKELDADEEAYLAVLREPALVKEVSGSLTAQKQDELEEYLLHIFEQPLEQAYRRNRGFWGRQYLQNKRSEGRIIEKYVNLKEKKPIRFLRKLIKGK